MSRLSELISVAELADEIYTDAWVLGLFQWLEVQMCVDASENGPGSLKGARPASRGA